MAISRGFLASQTNTLPAVAIAVGLLLVYGVYRLLRVGSRDKRLPPGPPTWPVLGNLHLIPATGLGKKYDIPFLSYYLDIAG